MTPAATTQFKLGVFALAVVAATIGAIIALGLRSRTATIRYQTYFDESVQGLSIGSPVKYRGVWIGSIAEIAIAPDRRQVSVGLGLERESVARLGLATTAPRLRTQLAIQGVTGIRFVDIDVVDPEKYPLPRLGFTPARNYIASRPSMFSGLEGRLGGVIRDLPALIEHGITTLDKVGVLVDGFQREQLPGRVADVVDELGGTARDLRRWIGDLQRARLPANAAATLARVDAALVHLEPLIASAKRTSDAFGELGRSTRSGTRDLDRTIGEIDEAARAVRELAETLQRQPDMLVKGRRTR